MSLLNIYQNHEVHNVFGVVPSGISVLKRDGTSIQLTNAEIQELFRVLELTRKYWLPQKVMKGKK